MFSMGLHSSTVKLLEAAGNTPSSHLLIEKKHILVKNDHICFIEYTEAIPLSSHNAIQD